jgi:hypothetical protein
MENIEVHQVSGDNFVDQLTAFVNSFKNLPLEDSLCTFDFRKISWITPLTMLGAASIITENRNRCGFLLPNNKDVSSYFQALLFPHGSSDHTRITGYNSYVPICAVELNDPPAGQKLLSTFQDKVLMLGGFDQRLKTPLFFPISELVENILQHSECQRGYFLAQFYRKKGFVEITIVDRGIGLRQSYQKYAGLILSHSEAIEAALNGISTSRDNTRGRGIPKSRESVCDKLNGCLMLITGDSALISENDTNLIYNLGDFMWDGVVLHMRIPRNVDPVGIDITDLYG